MNMFPMYVSRDILTLLPLKTSYHACDFHPSIAFVVSNGLVKLLVHKMLHLDSLREVQIQIHFINLKLIGMSSFGGAHNLSFVVVIKETYGSVVLQLILENIVPLMPLRVKIQSTKSKIINQVVTFRPYCGYLYSTTNCFAPLSYWEVSHPI